MKLKLPDRLVKLPKGIVENMFIRVKKFLIPTDIIVLDIVKDHEIPIILDVHS